MSASSAGSARAGAATSSASIRVAVFRRNAFAPLTWSRLDLVASWPGRVGRRSRVQLVTDRDLAGVYHFRIDPAVGVAEAAQQRLRDRQVARAGVGIDVGRRATHDALDDLEPRAAPDRDLAA